MIYEEYIEINPEIMMGKPIIKGTRIPVYVILNLLGEGYNVEMVKKEYPDVTDRDVLAGLKFAAHTMKFEEIQGVLV